ncbi:MAG: hypothetical protein HDS68_02270 [Bacteroidales bacterium]|nr:hypothetical protein [Bacteroidales bacterium]
MKRLSNYVTIACLLLFLISCSQDEPELVNGTEDPYENTFDDLRSVEDILRIATDASSLVEESSTHGLSRGYGRVIDVSSPIVPIMNDRSRGGDTTKEKYDFTKDRQYLRVQR